MKLVVPIRLMPDASGNVALRMTLERCNAACDWLATLAHDGGIRRQYDLHHAAYADIRTRFGLTAQAAVRLLIADSATRNSTGC